MPTIQQPRICVLDTSLLNQLARDWTSEDLRTQANAAEFISRLKDLGAYIGLSYLHVMEMLRHVDPKIAANRYRFLQNLPLVAWVRPFHNTWSIGTHVDIVSREFKYISENPATTAEVILSALRGDVWQTGVGFDIFQDDSAPWEMVAKIGQCSLSKEIVNASICHVDPTEIERVKLCDLAQMEKRDRKEIIAFSKSYIEQLSIALSRYGDRRLENPEKVARDFGNKTIERVLSLDAPDYSDHIKVAASYGISPLLIDDKMTVGEFSEIVARGLYIKNQLEKLRLNSSEENVQRCMQLSPTNRKWWQIVCKQKQLERAEGGNLTDASLAVLGPYADVLHVDKRTKELLCQLSRESSTIASQVERTFRGVDYIKLVQSIEECMRKLDL